MIRSTQVKVSHSPFARRCASPSVARGQDPGHGPARSQAGSDLFQEQDLELLAALACPSVSPSRTIDCCRKGHLEGGPQDPAGALAPISAADPGLPVLGMLPPRTGGGGRPLRLHRGRAGHVGPGQPQPWAVVLGDVAGKGMPAALISASIRPELRVLARYGVGPETCYRREPAGLRSGDRRAVRHAPFLPDRSPDERTERGQRGSSARADPPRQRLWSRR